MAFTIDITPGLLEALKINRNARVIAAYLAEEFEGNIENTLACLARIHLHVIEGSVPPFPPKELDQALDIHKRLVLQWLATNSKG